MKIKKITGELILETEKNENEIYDLIYANLRITKPA